MHDKYLISFHYEDKIVVVEEGRTFNLSQIAECVEEQFTDNDDLVGIFLQRVKK